MSDNLSIFLKEDLGSLVVPASHLIPGNHVDPMESGGQFIVFPYIHKVNHKNGDKFSLQ